MGFEFMPIFYYQLNQQQYFLWFIRRILFLNIQILILFNKQINSDIKIIDHQYVNNLVGFLMGAICTQNQYTQFDKKKDDFSFDKSFKNIEKQKIIDSLKFQQSSKKMQEKDLKEAEKFQQSIKKMEEKKKLEDKKFQQSLKKLEFSKKKIHPSDTNMAKLLYAYMRLYGSNPDYNKQIEKFISENYNSNYCSYLYRLNNSTPIVTYKYEVEKRFKTAHQNGMISDHQTFTKADETNRTIQYTWTTRKQITNHRTLYECQATFDEQNRFLKVILRQTDRFNYRPPLPPVQSKKIQKSSWQTSTNNYVGETTDWGAYYNAQTQRSNQQFRANMNKQAQEWNNYAQQKNARGW